MKPEDKLEIGKALRDARERQSLTQAYVADIVGVKQPTISWYERGQWDDWTLEAFANALGLQLEVRIRTEDAPNLSPRQHLVLERIAHAIAKADPAAVNVALSLLETSADQQVK